MPAASDDQLKTIETALHSVHTVITEIIRARNDAATRGDIDRMQALNGPFWDAYALQERLTALRTITETDALAPAIAAVKRRTETLDHEKAHLDSLVTALGTAATIIDAIAKVAAAVAKL